MHIRDIAAMPLQAVIDEFNETSGTYMVEFDDGVLEHNGAEIVYTRHILNYWLALPRGFQLLKRYSIAYDRKIDPHTHLELCGRIFYDYCTMYDGTKWDINDSEMNLILYRDVINELYNFHVRYLTPYIQGTNSFDLIEIIKHPDIKAAHDKLKNKKGAFSAEDISHVHDIIQETILKDPALKHNSYVIALRAKTIKMQQMQMVIGPIGFGTDINSNIFPYPIVNSFYEGNNQLWQMAIESRNASTAILYNELVMPTSQYANRRYQLFASSIRFVVREDCGSTDYKETFVIDKKHLSTLLGLWYVNEETGQLEPIKTSDTHLIGKTIRHRFITHCHWKGSRAEFCSKCYGQIYRVAATHDHPEISGVRGRNIGHIAAAFLGGATSSQVLGRKHSKSSATTSGLSLVGVETEYVKLSEDGNTLHFHNDLHRLKHFDIVLLRNGVEHIFDLAKGNIDRTHPSAITRINSFLIRDHEAGINNPISVWVGSNQRAAYLTDEALDYILKYGWELSKDKDLIISLEHWDKNKPFIVVPQVELSPPEFINSVVSFLLGAPASEKEKGAPVKRRCLMDYNSLGIDKTVDIFYDEIREHLSIHQTHLATLVLALSVQNPENNDYRLPYPRNSGKVLSEEKILFNVSMGMSMAYEKQHSIIGDPRSFIVDKRRSHPLDGLLLSNVYGNRKTVYTPFPRDNKR